MQNQIKHSSGRFGGYEFSFGRINVILGANGVGKSSFLAELKGSIANTNGGGKVVYVEGGRTIKIKDQIVMDHTTVQKYDRFESALQAYEKKRVNSLADRVFDAIVVLEKKGLEQRSKHSDSVERWIEGGQNGPCPRRTQPPLEYLFELFHEIFPQIALTYDYSARKLVAEKNGAKYGPSRFSDGEKQVFSLLADVIDTGSEHRYFIVDEPELNLHPELAERLWSLIEDLLFDRYFIYATHNINFAMRDNVDVVYVLSNESEKISTFSNVNEIDDQDMRAFLGCVPGILASDRVVVTEGHEKSFDSVFYRWILQDDSLEIFPAGNCHDVSNVISKRGVWNHISSKVRLCGVIDADFGEQPPEDHCLLQLPLHEAESCISVPKLIVDIATHIGSQEKIISEDEVSKIVLDLLEESKLGIAARRVAAKNQWISRISVSRSTMKGIENEAQLVEKLKNAAQLEAEKASQALEGDTIESAVRAELAMIQSTLEERNIEQALKLLPGKEVANLLAPRVGCKSALDLARAIKKNLQPSNYPHLVQIKTEIEAVLAL